MLNICVYEIMMSFCWNQLFTWIRNVLCVYLVPFSLQIWWSSSAYAHTTTHALKTEIVMIPTLSSLVAQQVVVMSICGASNSDKVGIIGIIGFQWKHRLFHGLWGNLCDAYLGCGTRPVTNHVLSERRDCYHIVITFCCNVCYSTVW